VARRIEPGSLAAQPATAAQTVAEDSLQILLVDDRLENLHALEAVLAPLGVPIVTATSGRMALRLLLEHDFAVILLDVRMPGMDGLETARMIKSRERTRETPIVFLTAARDEVTEVLRGYEAGAVDYVLKPFDPDLLRSKVSIFIELEQGRRALQRSEEFLRAAFEYAPIGKTLLDEQLRIVRSNPAFERLLGYRPEELEGREVGELAADEDRDALVEALHRIEQGDPGDAAPGAVGVDVRLCSSGGNQTWVAMVGSAIERPELAETRLLAQWIDLSARRRAEQARAELMLEQSARTQAEQMAERLGKLQSLTDALDSLSLDRLLGELALRISELFGVDASEVRVHDAGGEQTIIRALGGRILAGADESAWPRSGDWVQEPMRIERGGLGMVALHVSADRSFTAAERALLRDAADRAALAIQQALLFEQEHRTAVLLQRGLLPKRLPEVSGLRLAARYEAAGVAAEVGGDWYDAFSLRGGRLGVVVGDVAGRGIPAASTMGQLRAVTRAIAIQDKDKRLPGEVLTRLNHYQLSIEEKWFVTLVYAIVDPVGATLSWAIAGHLPPLIRLPDGRVEQLGGGSLPLGTEEVAYGTETRSLSGGELLVLYTDGLVERRGEMIDAGLGRLASAVSELVLAPQQLCDELLARLLSPDEHLYDDVTAVVVELEHEQRTS